MEFEDHRKQRSERFKSEHELDDDMLEQLIEGKFKRARDYYEALRSQEDLFAEQD